MNKQEIITKRNRYLKVIKIIARICDFVVAARGNTREFIKECAKQIAEIVDKIFFHYTIRGLGNIITLLHKRVPKDVLIVYDGTLEDRDKNWKIYDKLDADIGPKIAKLNYYCRRRTCTKYIKGIMSRQLYFKSECYGHSFSTFHRYWACCDEHNEKAAT